LDATHFFCFSIVGDIYVIGERDHTWNLRGGGVFKFKSMRVFLGFLKAEINSAQGKPEGKIEVYSKKFKNELIVRRADCNG
jgi:hypothetical protein